MISEIGHLEKIGPLSQRILETIELRNILNLQYMTKIPEVNNNITFYQLNYMRISDSKWLILSRMA